MFSVLLIEDEDGVREAVARRLERHGVRVTAVDNAEKGVEAIRSTDPPFDVIVTDMSLENPESGLHILNAAFARDLFAEVIVMTAYGNVANAVECMRRGAFDYIEKNMPGVDVYEMLIIKVDQAMDRRRQDVRTIEKWERAARAKEKSTV